MPFRRVARKLAAVTIATGVLVSLGWQFRVGLLKGEALGTFVAPNTALLLICFGVAVFAKSSQRRMLVYAGNLPASVIAAFAALTLWEHAFRADLGIDRLYLAHRLGDWYVASPVGRIELPTTLGFAAAGVALLVVGTRWARLADLCAALIASISYLGIVGYLYDVKTLYGRMMAPFTAVLLACMAVCLFALAGRFGAFVAGRQAGAIMFRRVASSLALLMPLFGWVYVRLLAAGFVDVGTGMAALILISVAVFAGAVLHTVAVLNRLDAEKAAALQAVVRGEKLAAAGRLAATVAHEINNPLEALMNLLYLLRGAQSEDERRRYHELADEELRRVSAISRQTLGFYREDVAPETFDLVDCTREVLQVFSSRIRKAGAVVTLLAGTEPVLICAGRGEIKQIVSNLLSNALEALARVPAPSLVISVSRNAGAAQVSLQDNGCGIPEADRDRIFEPFFTTKPETGTGLGLFVTRQLVEKHHGTIGVQSPLPSGNGAGTRFTLSFPLAFEQRRAAAG